MNSIKHVDLKNELENGNNEMIKTYIQPSRELGEYTEKCSISENGRCGPKFGRTICPAGYCSKWWWCGTSSLHKKTHQVAYDAKPSCSKKVPTKTIIKKKSSKVDEDKTKERLLPGIYSGLEEFLHSDALARGDYNTSESSVKNAEHRVEGEYVNIPKTPKLTITKNGKKINLALPINAKTIPIIMKAQKIISQIEEILKEWNHTTNNDLNEMYKSVPS